MTTVPSSDTTGFDPAALIEQYQAGVWRYLRVLGCTSEEAEDLTQETFLSVLSRPFKHYSQAATSAYLRKVAYHLFVSAHRRSKRVRLIENVEELDYVWSKWAGQDNWEELILKLKSCLDGLTERARRALEMRFRDRSSRSAIAEELEITEHGAKNLMQRAKQQLRKCVESKKT